MAIQAQLADGRLLEFPDGTDHSVIQSTVKRLISESAPTQAAPAPGGIAATLPVEFQGATTPAEFQDVIGAEPAVKKSSVLEGMQMPAPLPTEDKLLNPRFVTAVQAELNSQPADKRAAMLQKLSQRTDVYGRAAKVIQGRYEALDRPGQDIQQLRNLSDMRLEQQQRRFIDQGMEPQAALNLARQQAQQGVMFPDLQQMTRDIQGEKESREAARQQERLKDAGFFERVGAETRAQYEKSGLGLMNVYADLTGDTQLQKDVAGASKMVEAGQRAIPKGTGVFERSAQGAISSLAGQTPMIAMSMLTGTAAPTLLYAGIQQFGDSYGEARAAGQSAEAALARAIPMAAAEVFFERFGLTKAGAGLKEFVAKHGYKSLPKYFAEAVAKEVPAEMATTLAQYGVDVLPGVGLNKNPSLLGLYQELEETLRQTILQSGAQVGTTLGAAKGVQKLSEAVAKTAPKYERDTSWDGVAELLARKSGFMPLARDESGAPITRETRVAPPAVSYAVPREEQIAALADEIEATGIPSDDARVQAEQTFAAREEKEQQRLAPRIIELTQEYVDAGMEPQQANQRAIEQAKQEAADDEQALRDGAVDTTQPVGVANRAGVSVAGQPGAGAAPTGAGVVEPSGVVPLGSDAGRAAAGEGKQSSALTGEPPVAPGFTRVYHSGQKGEGTTGRWASTSRDYAANYRPDLPLFYTDIPSDDPRVNNPDYPDTQGVKQGFTFNFELTPQEATQLTEVPREGAPTTEAPKAKRGRPAILTPEQKEQRAADKKVAQAAKARVERRLAQLNNTATALSVPPTEDEFETDEDYANAIKEHNSARLQAIKELLQLQQDPAIRGTKVGERVAEALKKFGATEKEKADLRAGIEAQKRALSAAGEGKPSASRITKGEADTTFGKFTNGVQALGHIIKTGTAFQKMLGKRLRGFVTNVRFQVIEDGQELPAQLRSAKNAPHWERSIALYIENYKTGDRVIYVRGASFGVNQGVNNITILHELLHAATNRKINLAIDAIKKGVNLDSALVRSAADLLRTMNSAASTFNQMSREGRLPEYISLLADKGDIFEYGGQEFIAYGLTDPEFQKFLMQAKGYEEDTSYFNRFVRGIRELFGMDEDATNALTDLVVVTDNLLSTRAPQYPTRGEQVSRATADEPIPADQNLPGETEVKARPSANVQRLAKMLGSKLYGTPKDIAKVSIKELFQNSFDAIKGALEQGQLTKGKVDIKLDDSNRTIRIIDNGLGMPTSVMGNQFLQIAGTVKETKRASGGLGVAKMLFLFENKQLEVVSLRDGVLSRMVTTGDDLKSALDDPSRAPTIQISSDPTTVAQYTKTLFPDGHGTAVTVTIPESFTNESTGNQEDIPFSVWDLKNAPVLEYSPLFDDIEVTLDRGWGPDALKLGANFPVDEYTPFANVNFAWGTARIYVSKEKVDHSWKDNTHVLSNGLWQFNTSIKDRPGINGKNIKRTFYVDVTPAEGVKPEDAGYPFDLNRQNFSKAASEDFQKIFSYITTIYSQIDYAQGIKNFGTVQYVNFDGTLTTPESLEPKAPQSESAFTLIKPDDAVEVRDGVLYVNNRPLPELTAKDLENASVRVEELTIPQEDIDHNKVMIHDNTETSTPGRLTEADAKQALDKRIADDPYGFKLTDLGNGRYWMVTYDIVGQRTQQQSGTPTQLLEWLKDQGFWIEPVKSAPISLTDLARQTFGDQRVNKYLATIGDVFHTLRDALLSVSTEHADLGTQALGVSIDVEYYGVSILVPFKGMFINPATTDLKGTPAQVAVSMIGTMVHEMAHFKVRGHGGDFAHEMQKIMTLLDTHPSFDLQQAKKDLTKFIGDNEDIFQFLDQEFRNGNLKPRGNRFKDASYQQIGDEGAAEPVEGGREAEQAGSSVPAGAGEGAGAAQQVGQPAGVGGETAAVGNAVRTQKELNRAVGIATHKFETSQDGEKFAEAVSLLQMMQDPRKVMPAIRALLARMNDGAREALVRVMTNDFLADLAAKEVPELLNTEKLMQKMAGMTQSLLRAAGDLTNDIARAYRKDKTLRAKLERLTHVATLAEYDPADTSLKVRNKALDDAYAALGPEGQRVYNRIKNHFETLSNYFSKLLDDQITQSGLPMAEQANLIKKIRAIYETGSKITPYFPLVRRGDYWLSTGKGNTRAFFMYESAAERDAAMRGFADEKIKRKPNESAEAFNKRREELHQELQEDGYFTFGNDIGALRRTTVGNSQLLTGIFAEIDGMHTGTDFTPEAKEQLKDAVYQVYLQTMPEQSFRKQFIHRKGTAGFRTDLLRNVADTTTKMATQLARIKYAPLLRNSLSQARTSITNRPKFEPYVASFERRVSDALSAGKPSVAERFAGTANKFSFIFYLGGVSSALLQPLSLFQTGVPVLMKYGVGNAYAEMGNMLKVWNEFGAMRKNADGSFSWTAPSIENITRSADERRAIRDVIGRDVIASTYARNVLDYKATPTDKLPSPQVQFTKDAVNALVFGGLMHSTERLSREAMFLAAYRLNRKLGRDHATAVDNAVIDVNEALGNYGQYNRPEFMKGAPGKVLTQFMMYPVHTTLFLMRNFVEMLKPMNGRTRWEATKKFMGTMSHTWILGGAVGLWGFSTIMGLLGAFWNALDKEDWPEDVKNMSYELWWRSRWLPEMLGGTQIAGHSLADIVERGPVNAITGVDISSRVSLNNMWMRDTKEHPTVREEALAFALEHAGPTANAVLSMAESYDAFAGGDYKKGVLKAAPAGFRNFINAYSYWKEGAKDNKGAEILSRDAFTTGELLFQAIGFRSDLLANTQYVTFKVLGLEQKIQNERTGIMNKLDRAFRNNDVDAYTKYFDDMHRFNTKHPSYAITTDNLLESLTRKQEQRAKSWRGVVLTEKNVGPFSEALLASRKAADEREARNRGK